MSTKEFGKINSHNEWDKLKEIIVGTSRGTMATLTWNRPEPLTDEVREKGYALAKKACPDWFYQEVEEDLDGLAETLRRFGVTVHRPEPFDLSFMYGTPFWSSTSNNLYNTRDLNLVVGNCVIESPSYLESRYYETTGMYPIWYRYFEKGFKWIAGPKPMLNYDAKLPYFRDEKERELTEEDIKHQQLTGGRLEKLHKLSEKEILFEAANTCRMGRDLLYLISSSGNELGARWLQSVLGDEYRVHTTRDIYRSSHIDSTVMCLRPGLVLLNDTRVTEKNCPPIFNSWDKLYFSEVAPTSESELKHQKEFRDPIGYELEALGFRTNLHDMSSPWVGLNFLSIDQETVVVDHRQAALIKLLEKHKFTVVPIRMRHIYTQGGGIHCATLDTVRESKLESYFE
jgi:glycine amidinotransferase/scyllo-inosamine-4-phosphate amidinotransferase 1